MEVTERAGSSPLTSHIEGDTLRSPPQISILPVGLKASDPVGPALI